MKIEKIIKVEMHTVITDEEHYNEYTRYSATDWILRMNGYDEPLYKYDRLEKKFQNMMAKEKRNENSRR